MIINKVPKLIKRFGLTQYGFAKKTGIHPGTIRGYVKGAPIGHTDVIDVICATFNVPVNDVVEWMPDAEQTTEYTEQADTPVNS